MHALRYMSKLQQSIPVKSRNLLGHRQDPLRAQDTAEDESDAPVSIPPIPSDEGENSSPSPPRLGHRFFDFFPRGLESRFRSAATAAPAAPPLPPPPPAPSRPFSPRKQATGASIKHHVSSQFAWPHELFQVLSTFS